MTEPGAATENPTTYSFDESGVWICCSGSIPTIAHGDRSPAEDRASKPVKISSEDSPVG